MAFEIMRKGRQLNERQQEPFIAIQATGHLVMNKLLTRWFRSHSATAVIVAYDRDIDTMALQPSKKGTRYSYSLNDRGNQASITIRSALKWMDDPSPGRYDAIVNGDQIEIWLRRRGKTELEEWRVEGRTQNDRD